MGAEDFSVLRNLAFYPNFNTRLVYFKSLVNYVEGPEPYNEKRLEVLSDADDGLKGLREKNQDNLFSNTASKFLQCHNFIKKAVEYESANELAYFESKLNELKTTFSEKEQEIPYIQDLIKLFENSRNAKGSIDYKNFLALVNSLLQGIKNTKAIISYEKKRIEDIDNALQTMKDNRKNQLIGLAEHKQMSQERTQQMLDKALSRQEQKIDAYYIKNKNYASKRDRKGRVYERLTGATTAFKSIPKSVAVEMSDWMNKQLNNILNNSEVMETLINYILNTNILNENYKSQIETFTKSIILQALTNQAYEHLPQILNNQYRNIPKKKIIEELEKSINITQSYRIQGFYQNFGMTGKHLKGYEDMEKDFDLHDASAQEFMEMFQRLRKAINQNYELTNVQNNLYEYMEQNEIYEKFADIGKLIAGLQKLEEKLRLAEMRISKQVQKDVKNIAVNLGKSATQKGDVKLTVTVTPNGVIFDGFEEGLKSTKAFQQIFGEDSDMKISSVKNSIATLTHNASIALRNTLADSVDRAIAEAETDDISELKYQLNTMIRDGLQNIKVRVNGPDVSEIISAINFETNDRGHITVNWSGKSKIKNDHIVVSVDRENFHFSTSFEKLIGRTSEKIADLIANYATNNEIEEQLAVNVVNAFQNATAKAFARNTTAQTERYSRNAKAFLDQYYRFSEGLRNVSDEYIKVMDDWEAFKAKLERQEMGADVIKEKYLKMIQSLENSFYISTTVKTYNQYTNKLGFGGGSIGANLSNQLSNIADVFSLAGMPLSKGDIEWLYYAIINCADTTVQGRRNEATIEEYLGSMAAFMLFDEGGAETKILTNLTDDLKQIKPSSSPKILHLYNVNGIYVTGSYVLQQVSLALDNCGIMFDKITAPNYKGAGIRIINPMNERMIPNRGSSVAVNTDPWGYIANEASKKVNLEIFFLAGLLDIIGEINEAMGNIELPA